MEEIAKIKNTKPQIFKIGVYSLGHLVNDLYMNQIQVLIPFWIIGGLSAAQGGFLVAIFTISSSLVQPLFGHLADRKSYQWLIYCGTAWMAVLLSFMGLTRNYIILFIIAMLAGLGTAAFHPQASTMVAKHSGNRKSFSQAIFIAMGNVGWALTPLFFVPLVSKFGMKISPFFAIPGLFISFLFWIISRNQTFAENKKRISQPAWPAIKENSRELTNILLIIALRSLAYAGLIAYLPLYLKGHGISLVESSRMISLMLFTGSIGGLIGGFMADKYGRKPILVISLALTTPLYALFLITHGWISIAFLAIAGAFLLSTFSITVTAAQKIISHNTGLASGLTLGLGQGIGGLGVGLIGLLADHVGFSIAIYCLCVLPLIASLFGLNLKKID
ncbi:MAG: MFS transporter [Prevotella sp.]|nr:MFS transporter [Prevotella sp.]